MQAPAGGRAATRGCTRPPGSTPISPAATGPRRHARAGGHPVGGIRAVGAAARGDKRAAQPCKLAAAKAWRCGTDWAPACAGATGRGAAGPAERRRSQGSALRPAHHAAAPTGPPPARGRREASERATPSSSCPRRRASSRRNSRRGCRSARGQARSPAMQARRGQGMALRPRHHAAAPTGPPPARGRREGERQGRPSGDAANAARCGQRIALRPRHGAAASPSRCGADWAPACAGATRFGVGSGGAGSVADQAGAAAARAGRVPAAGGGAVVTTLAASRASASRVALRRYQTVMAELVSTMNRL